MHNPDKTLEKIQTRKQVVCDHEKIKVRPLPLSRGRVP